MSSTAPSPAAPADAPSSRRDSRAARKAARGEGTPSDHLSFGRSLAWATAPMSAAANVMILMYITIYATDTLRLPAAMVGTSMMVAKIVDAFGTLAAGWIVDRSPETRWGKARPYDLALLGMWVFTGMIFSTPTSWSTAARLGWLMGCYTLITAVFNPLFSGSGLLYMGRALPNRQVWAKASTRSGLITGLMAIVISVTFPLALNSAGKSPSGWSHAVWMFSVPLLILGVLRFVTTPERYVSEQAAERVSFRDILGVLKTNKWLWTLGLIQLCGGIYGNIGAGTYYFRYIVGNIGLIGVLAPLNLIVLPLMLLLPRLMKRFTVSQLIMAATAIGVVGFLVNFVAGKSLPVLVVAGLLTGLAAVPVSFLLPILLLDNSALNEFNGHRRLESVNGAATNFFGNVGSGISSGIAGWVLSAAGYDGAATTQSGSARFAIVALFSLIPAVLSLSVVVLAWFSHRYEVKMPAVRAALDERHHASEQEATEAAEAPEATQSTLRPAMVEDADLAAVAEGEVPAASVAVEEIATITAQSTILTGPVPPSVVKGGAVASAGAQVEAAAATSPTDGEAEQAADER